MPLGKCRLVATNKNTLIFGIVLGWSIHKDCMTQFQFGPSIIEVWQIWRFPKFGCPKSSNTRPLKYWKPWFWGSPIVGNLHISRIAEWFVKSFVSMWSRWPLVPRMSAAAAWPRQKWDFDGGYPVDIQWIGGQTLGRFMEIQHHPGLLCRVFFWLVLCFFSVKI